jgi:tetratricopeptide (TPR) repeat protein
MPLRRRLRTSALLACIAAATVPGAALAEPSTPANVAAARRHFDKARADYEKGAYREAITELEAAHSLDPSAKDLVFNLGVVHEKLADIEEALTWFHLYTTMSLLPQERDRADAYIRRLEGAKNELERKRAAAQPAPIAPPPAAATIPPQPREPQPEPPAPQGRVDGLTITAIGVTGAALAFGTFMAIKATRDEPPSGFVTGRDGTYSDLVNEQHSAHSEAVLADVGFGVSVIAGTAAALLYFGRSRTAASVAAAVSVLPIAGGGAIHVQGSF